MQPGESVGATTDEQAPPDDFELIRSTQLAKVAAAAMVGASVMSIVVAFQGLAILQLRGIYQLSELVFVLLGVAGIVAAKRLAAMRHQGAWLVVVVGGGVAFPSLEVAVNSSSRISVMSDTQSYRP